MSRKSAFSVHSFSFFKHVYISMYLYNITNSAFWGSCIFAMFKTS